MRNRTALGGAVVSVFLLGTSLTLANPVSVGSRLINGTPVPAGTHLEVVSISSQGSACTATVVGPRVILTAAHCANSGQAATFKVGTKTYSAMITRSSLYPQKDHDVALGITLEDIQGIKPVLIGGKAVSGIGISLLGYGCTQPGGGTGTSDGILRIGDTVITGFSDFDMVSRKAGGAAVCFGDSGGPAFVMDGNTMKVLGINSKGNIQDTNYDIRTDIPETQTFFQTFAQTNNAVICGVNSDCSNTPPPPPAPTCTLAANPNSIHLGDTTTISIVTTNATDAAVEGQSISVPNGQMPYKPSIAGVTTVHAVVHGAGGTGNCQTDITVTNTPPPPPTAPTCTLSASPQFASVGDVVVLELDTQGNATSATIDGTSVAIPVGKKMVTTTTAGSFQVNGVVSGQGGTNGCSVTYTVDNGPPPPPPGTPNFAVVATYCGMNTLGTSVSKVCLAVVKKDANTLDLRITDALLITYNDGSMEAAPIISRKTEPSTQPGDLRVIEDLTVYANRQVSAGNYVVLDTNVAILTKLPPLRDGAVPASLQGKSPRGVAFTVDQLKPFGVSAR